MWWCSVSGLVDAHGHSWCSHHVVTGGVVVVGHHGHLFVHFIVVCHCGSFDMAPVLHVQRGGGHVGLSDSPA